MHKDFGGEPVLRFQVQVPRADYKTLVARLRGEDAGPFSRPCNQPQVTALIDLSPNSSTFSITRIGHHRLPRAVSIRTGSPTHHLLTHTIFRELERINDPLVTERLKAIVAACPAPLPSTLRVNPADFVLAAEPAPSAYTHSLSTPSGTAVRILATLAPTILLDLDDTPPLIITQGDKPSDETTLQTLRSALSTTLHLQAIVEGNSVTLTGSVTMPALPRSTTVTLFAHWGSYEELSKPWQDTQIPLCANPRSAPDNVTFTTTLHAPIQGSYGVTLYALLNDSRERIWIGRPWFDDCKFTILRDDPHTISARYQARQELLQEAIQSAQAILRDPFNAAEASAWFTNNAPHLSLGAVLASETSHSQTNREILETAISTLRSSGAESLANSLSASYGVGEIVFVTPEGPHAAAGGLAHVITGLPTELTTLGVPVTIIAPLYRYANGNKHRAAEEILRDGISLGRERVTPRYVTTIVAELGPTHYTGTPFHKRPATSVPCKVYVAESGKLRLFLLANSSAFDRLYQPVYADEQLRRSVLLSRAALETIATEALDIRPSALISNDWMTACVPSLLALDPRYKRVSWLQQTKALHMIHNGGADYHGRLPLHFGNEDLWPLLGLAPEHYFGFRDPHRGDLINLTMAAAQHASGGILTVSQPYAQALVSPTGGDGLEYILQNRQEAVFGISNGINRTDIDTYLAARVNHSTEALQTVPGLLHAKATIRAEIQRAFGLQVDPAAQIVSFVGRLAEQKGLHLLSGFVEHAAHSTLEDILVRHPTAQIIIAGPVTSGDLSAAALHDAVRYLQHRYPGRIGATFDYISHSHALEIMAASTLFLMPSRFEPGGITQLEALAVGTPVVGRSVGGITATIENYDPTTGRGTGFLCHDYAPTAFANTIHWALATCADAQRYNVLVKQAISAHHSWADRAPVFLAVLQRVIVGTERAERLEFLEPSSQLVAGARVTSWLSH